jgi:hypothetical protein
VDLSTVEFVKELESPWINNNSDNMITQLMALRKGSGSSRIRTELETIKEEEGLRKYARVYTDGSVMDERSGCAIVMGQREVKIRLAGNFQCGAAGNHRGNKDHKKMGSGQTHNND